MKNGIKLPILFANWLGHSINVTNKIARLFGATIGINACCDAIDSCRDSTNRR